MHPQEHHLALFSRSAALTPLHEGLKAMDWRRTRMMSNSARQLHSALCPTHRGLLRTGEPLPYSIYSKVLSCPSLELVREGLRILLVCALDETVPLFLFCILLQPTACFPHAEVPDDLFESWLLTAELERGSLLSTFFDYLSASASGHRCLWVFWSDCSCVNKFAYTV